MHSIRHTLVSTMQQKLRVENSDIKEIQMNYLNPTFFIYLLANQRSMEHDEWTSSSFAV